MDEVIKLVKNYRIATGAADGSRLAEAICRAVAPKLSFFIFSAIRPPDADEVLQETLTGIFTGLKKFAGSSNGEFWHWCYGIARHKINDYLRKKSSDRLTPMEPALLNEIFDSAISDSGLSAADRTDFVDAMEMLHEANPECHDYLWQHYILGLDYGDIAAERSLGYDAVRMRVKRCLEAAPRCE